jgi:hypothetical protein
MNIVCRICRGWILQRRIQSRLPDLERVVFAWGHDAVLARKLATAAARVCASDLNLFRADAELRIALYRAVLAGYRRYQREHREVLNLAPGEHVSAARRPLARKVRRAMRQLDERQRMIVGLIDLGGCGYAEVERILVLSRAELLAELCNARAQLKQLLLGHAAGAAGRPSQWGMR